MKFFVPRTKPSEYEVMYNGILNSVKDQLRTPIAPRRIFSIDYVHDKKRVHAEVGGLDPHQGRYQIIAIFESKPHILFTRNEKGGPGVTILVNSDEITEIQDFAS